MPAQDCAQRFAKFFLRGKSHFYLQALVVSDHGHKVQPDVFLHRKVGKVLLQQTLAEFNLPFPTDVVEDDIISILQTANRFSTCIHQNARL